MSIAVAGFEGLVEIHHSASSLVLKGVRSADGQRVILKTTAGRRPSGPQIARLVRERRLVGRAQGDHVVRLIDALDDEGAPVLVFEDFGGRSLDRVPDALPLAERVALAVDIARALEAVHGRGVIHKDVNPSNLVWNRATSTLKLVDFGIATNLKRETPSRGRAEFVEGTLGYVSPEQTGRMNCSVDRRSDLYSLGVTLYELFAGQRPFEGDDPLEARPRPRRAPPRPPPRARRARPARALGGGDAPAGEGPRGPLPDGGRRGGQPRAVRGRAERAGRHPPL